MKAIIYAASGNWQEIDPVFLCKYYNNLDKIPKRRVDTVILEKVKLGCNEWELRGIYRELFTPDPLTHNFNNVNVPRWFNKRKRID